MYHISKGFQGQQIIEAVAARTVLKHPGYPLGASSSQIFDRSWLM